MGTHQDLAGSIPNQISKIDQADELEKMFEPFPPIGIYLYEHWVTPKFKPWRTESEVLQSPIYRFESAYNYIPGPTEVREYFNAMRRSLRTSAMIEGLTRVQKGEIALEGQFLYNQGEDLLFDKCRFIVISKPPRPEPGQQS